MAFRADTLGTGRGSLVIEIGTPSTDTEDARHKIVITVDSNSPDLIDAFVHSLEMFTQAFLAQMHPVPADTIASVVALIVPKKPVPSTLLREARMLAQAKIEILQSNDWVTAREISKLAHFSSNNPSSQPNKWKHAGKIFALRHEGGDYFPIYGLDSGQGFRPLPALERVIATLATMKDGWAMAFWFASPNTFLGGRRPKEVLWSNPSGVLSAAKEEVSGVLYG